LGMRELVLPVILGLLLSGAVIYTSLYLAGPPDNQVYSDIESGLDDLATNYPVAPDRMRDEMAIQATPAIIIIAAPVDQVDRVVLRISGDYYTLGGARIVAGLGLTYEGYRVVAIDMRVGGVLEEVVVESGGERYTWTGSVRLESGKKIVVVAE